MLIGWAGILESEMHYFAAIQSFISDEGHMLLLRDMYGNLVISQIGIHEAKQLVP